MRTKILLSFVQVAEEPPGHGASTLWSAARVLPCPEPSRTCLPRELLSLQFTRPMRPQPGFSSAPEPTSSGAAIWEVRTHLGPMPLSDLPPAPAEGIPRETHPVGTRLLARSHLPGSPTTPCKQNATPGVFFFFFAEAITLSRRGCRALRSAVSPGRHPRPEAGR